MAIEKSKAQFALVDDEEKWSRLRQLIRNQGPIYLWKKGEKQRLRGGALSLDDLAIKLMIKLPMGSQEYIGPGVLFNFILKNGQYFSSSELSSTEQQEIFALDLKGALYKFERRHGTRLLSYFAQDIKVLVPIESKTAQSAKGLIFDFPSKQSAQDQVVFSQFLNLMEGQNSLIGSGSWHIFQVADFSTKGISFFVTELEIPHFAPGTNIGNFYVRLNQEILQIQEGPIVYNVAYKDSKRPRTQIYKVAIEFKKLSPEVEDKLEYFIRMTTKNHEIQSAFEEIIV